MEVWEHCHKCGVFHPVEKQELFINGTRVYLARLDGKRVRWCHQCIIEGTKKWLHNQEKEELVWPV